MSNMNLRARRAGGLLACFACIAMSGCQTAPIGPPGGGQAKPAAEANLVAARPVTATQTPTPPPVGAPPPPVATGDQAALQAKHAAGSGQADVQSKQQQALDAGTHGDDTGNSKNGNGSGSSTGRFVTITPLSRVDDRWSSASKTGAAFNGAYTKIVVSSHLAAYTPSSGSTQSDASASEKEVKIDVLGYSPRTWWRRALWGTDFNIALTAKLHVKDNVDLNVPLAVVGHQSNSGGEAWVRELDTDRNDFPLFLYRSDGTSIPSVTLEIKGSNSISSRGAAAGISAITGLAKLAGAEPSVITKLTESSTRSASAAVDSAISNLMNSSITERYVSDRDLTRWNSEKADVDQGLVVEFRLPHDEESWDSQPEIVGRWFITFARPRPSIFFEWSICPEISNEGEQQVNRCSADSAKARAQVVSGVTASDVLHYKLVANANGLGDVDSYVRQQKWFTDATTALAKSATDSDQMNKFCQSAVDSITGLGLNEFDGMLVLWAINTGMPSGLPDVSASPKCKLIFDKLSATASTSTGTQNAAPAPLAAQAKAPTR